MEAFIPLVALGLIPEVNLLGRLTFAELLMLGVVPFIIQRISRNEVNVRRFYLFVALWFIGAAMSDIYRGTPLDDVLRGWAKIVFFTINFTGIVGIVNGRVRRLVLFILLLSAAGSVRLMLGINGDDFAQQSNFANAWKFGYGQFLTIAAFIVTARFARVQALKGAAMALPFVVGAVSLFLNARNLTAATLLAGVIGAVGLLRKRPLSRAQIGLIGIACAAAIFSLIQVYSFAASSGLLGKDAEDKYMFQTEGSLSLLQAGRSESLASIPAIIDSPIIGHGSWARDINYVVIMVTGLLEAGYTIRGNPYSSDLIPTHSHLLGAWVEHGVLGALFWSWVVWVTLKALLSTIRHPTALTGLLSFIALSFLWDIFFSPFGLERRLVSAAWLYLMLLICAEYDTKVRNLVDFRFWRAGDWAPATRVSSLGRNRLRLKFVVSTRGQNGGEMS